MLKHFICENRFDSLRKITFTICCMLFSSNVFAASSEDLFTVDVAEMRSQIEKDFNQAYDLVASNKFQDARSTLTLLETHLDRIKKQLPKDQTSMYQGRIDKIKGTMNTKVDSLVTRNLEIMHNDGIDRAVQFLQREMRMYGVPEEKLDLVDKAIMEEAPKVKRAQEKAAIDKTLKALENGEAPDTDTDPYILGTARRIYKIKQDSLKTIEDARLVKQQEEQFRIEKIKREHEEKARLDEEKRQAKIRKEDEKRVEAEKKIKNQQEKERTKQIAMEEKRLADSLANIEKQQLLAAKQEREKREEEEKTRLLAEKTERDRQQQLRDQQAKARRDSIDTYDKEQMRIALTQANVERQAQLERERKERLEKDRIDQMERAQQDKIDMEEQAQLERERQARLAQEQQTLLEQEKQTRLNRENKLKLEKERIGREEQERLIAQKRQKETDLEQQRIQKEQALQREQEQQAQLEQMRLQKEQESQMTRERQEQIDKQKAARQSSVQPQYPTNQSSSVIENTSNQTSSNINTAPIDFPPPPPIANVKSKASAGYANQLLESEKQAQDYIVLIYKMIDEGSTVAAVNAFKAYRSYIAQYVSTDVFNVLEQSIGGTSIKASFKKNGSATEVNQQPILIPRSELDQLVARINGYISQNKIPSAYNEFNRDKSQLKKYLTKHEFKNLEQKVKNAYGYYKKYSK